jgi:hypothetical protein
MLLHQADRHARHDIRVGDTLKMPLNLPSPLGGRIEAPYVHGTFEVIAFPVYGNSKPTHAKNRPMAHCITIRRRCDGTVKTIAAHYWLRLREAYHGE